MRILLFIFSISNFLTAQVSLTELNKKAIDYYQIEKYDSALCYFNKLIAAYPTDTMAYIDRALTKEMLGDFAGSIADYSRLTKVDSTELDAYFLRGIAYYHLGFLEAALSDFKCFISTESDNADAYYFIGKIFLQKKQVKIAKKYFEKAITFNPMHSESFYELAKFEFEHRKYNSSLILLNKSIEAFPTGDAYKLKCVISFKLNYFSDAAMCFEQLSILKPKDLSEVFKICIEMKKKNKINKYFLSKQNSCLNSTTIMSLSLLKGDFRKVLEIYSNLPIQEKDADFSTFLWQLANQFVASGFE